MTQAQTERMVAFLHAARPHVVDLRRRGYPVQVMVNIVDGHPVVSLNLDLNDMRVPIESEQDG